MPNFIKGNFEDYQTLLALEPEYSESLYLETTEHILYEGGQPLDLKIEVIDEVDPETDYLHKKSYKFIRPDGTFVIIEDAYIPPVEDYLMTVHDVSTGEEARYSNGLMSFRDKFVLEQMAELLGVKIKYTYWATVHHYSAVLNQDLESTCEVLCYKNDDDQWQYDYEDFEWIFINPGSHAELKVIVPAGSITLTESGIYPIPSDVVEEDGTHYHPTGDPIIIPGVNEVETVRVQSMKLLRESQDFNYFSPDPRPADTSTVIPIGHMPVGTTLDNLTHKTVSEVVAEVLFPSEMNYVKVSDTSAWIKFTDEYMEKYGDNGYIAVGSRYPDVNDFETIFIPETWQLMAGDQSIGDPVVKSEYVSTEFFVDDSQHLGMDIHGDPDDPSTYSLDDPEYEEHLNKFTVGALPHWCDHVLDHITYSTVDRSVYFGIINYRTIDPSSGEWVDASIKSSNYLGFEDHHTTHPHYTPEDNFEGSLVIGWPMLTNASDVSVESCWDERNIEPGEYIGDASVRALSWGIPEKPIYLRWPSGTKVNEHFYVYLPEEYYIAEVGGAHDGANEEWSARQTAEVDIDPETGEEIIIPISYKAFNVDVDVDARFKRWIIKKAAVITNIRIVIGDKTNEGEG